MPRTKAVQIQDLVSHTTPSSHAHGLGTRLVQTGLLVHIKRNDTSLIASFPDLLTFDPSICLLMQYCKQQMVQVTHSAGEKHWGQSIWKRGYNLHHWSLDGRWLAYLLKMLGPPCISRTLTIRNATANTPSAAALLKSPLSQFGQLWGSEKKKRSSSIPEFRFICMEWSRNTGTLSLPLTWCGLMNLRDYSPYRARRIRTWHTQL